jgi:50S ribosome-binding GTPase
MPLTLGGQYDEGHGKYPAPQAHPVAACDRLIALIQRALRLEPTHAGIRDDTILAPMTQYIAAQLRMRIRPALMPGWPAQDPVHVALLGGTNSGKSTVLNLLVGRAAAGMHATARFTQHPEAYLPNTLGDQWLTNAPSRFLDYHGYRDRHPPRQSDDDLVRHGYRPAFALFDLDRLEIPALAPPAAAAVFWDAPDFSTEAAQAYLERRARCGRACRPCHHDGDGRILCRRSRHRAAPHDPRFRRDAPRGREQAYR